ncbi:unnamed protein product [Xylocopa violacea]|uniref:Uncharacterized protein n=1 Tax=Xylocopa violacea TaxID=135666 RepID=A0ABP1PF26_XYLVO
MPITISRRPKYAVFLKQQRLKFQIYLKAYKQCTASHSQDYYENKMLKGNRIAEYMFQATITLAFLRFLKSMMKANFLCQPIIFFPTGYSGFLDSIILATCDPIIVTPTGYLWI